MFGLFAYISFWGGVEERVALLCVLSSAVAPSVAPARCCGRRPPLPVSPLAGSLVPAFPRAPSLRPSPLSSVAYVVPLPVAACVSAPSPFPRHTLPPATLSHRRPGAAGTTLHVDGLGSVRPPALLPPRRVFCSRCTFSHTRTLSLSHTRTHSLSLLTLALSHTHTLLVRYLRRPSRPAVARVVCTVRAWSRLVSSPSWLGRTARVCRPVMSCWLSLPSPLLSSSCPPLPSPFLAALPCPSAALSSPPPWACRCRQWPQRPPAKFRRGMYRWCRAPWLCAAAAGLIDSWSRPVMEFL